MSRSTAAAAATGFVSAFVALCLAIALWPAVTLTGLFLCFAGGVLAWLWCATYRTFRDRPEGER